ncbi:MAG: type II toxin-antitoxin system VapB family antitoxin [Solirubrobacterales bacterium]|nr:type II toxin-antitoxin system VapB family antitoxin [Solirubrobacterales bacterium]
MTRTNIDIDDELIRRAMERYGLRTKREAVDFALRRVVDDITPMTREELLGMEGHGWDGDLAEIKGKDRIEPPLERHDAR